MKIIDNKRLQEVIAAAEKSPRNRANDNFHTDDADTSRFLNAGNFKTYWRPHFHANRWEHIVVLIGKLGILKFDDLGNVVDKVTLDGNSVRGVEIEPGEYHMFVALTDPVVVDESKKGPYDPNTDKNWAPWSPLEDSEESKKYLVKARSYFGH